jgi:GNAT superfamily N-acetyltransferase
MTNHAINLRLARPSDAAKLQSYFRTLSKPSGYNRFLGNVADQSISHIDRTIGGTGSAFFCVIATTQSEKSHHIVGEAVCAATAAAEVALSVDDAVQGCGIGRALLATVEALAAQRGAQELYGTIFGTNDRIRKLACSLGYAIERSDGDWTHRLLRKTLLPRRTLPFIAGPAVVASPLPYPDGALGKGLGQQ